MLSAAVFLVVGTVLAYPFSARAATGKTTGVYTPAPGTVERKAILDAMRRKVKELHQLDVVFVVVTMKVGNGWSWVHTRPQSKDGSSHYEDVLALLKRTKGSWHVVEIPCTEPDNPDCIDSPGYFGKLAGRFPGMPPGLLPEDGR
ncbi:MAG: hypothetical protein FJZ79_03430 [Chlorobi bacterium]|nr:hypothetical protein [Chlorobiota bacterium]